MRTAPALTPALTQGPSPDRGADPSPGPGSDLSPAPGGSRGSGGSERHPSALLAGASAQAVVVEGEGGGGEGKGMPGVDDRKEARTWAGWGSAAAAAEVVAAARLKLGILVSEGRCTHRLRVAVSRTVSWRARVTVGRHAIRAIPRHARTPTPRLTLTAGAVSRRRNSLGECPVLTPVCTSTR